MGSEIRKNIIREECIHEMVEAAPNGRLVTGLALGVEDQ